MPIVPLALRIPLLFLALMALARLGLGEFWRWPSFDPDYVYLLNAQTVAERTLPNHIDHPGTPVQAFGAIVLHLMGATGRDVIQRPEHYLAVLAWLQCALAAAALWWFGAAARRCGASPRLILLAQCLPLLSAGVLLENLMRYNPEPILLATGLSISALLLHGGPFTGWRLAAAVGALCGFGLAAKISFLGVAIGMAFLFSPGGALVYAASLLASAAIFTVLVWNRLNMLADWISGLIFNQGLYGGSGAGVYNPSSAVLHGLQLLWEAPVAGVVVVLGSYVWWTTRRSPSDADRDLRRKLLAILIAIAAQLLIASKYSMVRYVLPVLALTGAALILSWRLAPESLRWKGFYAGAGFVLIAFAANAYTVASGWTQRNHEMAVNRGVIEDGYSDCLVLAHYRAANPAFALTFADFYTGSRFASQIDAQYPGLIRDNDPRPGRGAPLTQDIFWRRGCALAVGQEAPATYQPPSGTRVARLYPGKYDQLRILAPVAPPETCEARLGDGWQRSAADSGGHAVRAQQDAFIVVASPDEQAITITADQAVPSQNGRIETRWNGQLVQPSKQKSNEAVSLQFDLKLRKGWNRLSLHGASSTGAPNGLALLWRNIGVHGAGCAFRE